MSRSAIWLCCLVGGFWPLGIRGAETPQPPPVKELVVDPAPEPLPALRYRLLPIEPELIHGNAAPLYLRPAHGMGGSSTELLDTEPQKFLDLNFADIKPEDFAGFFDDFRDVLGHLEAGSLRAECDWNYPLHDPGQDPVTLLLPDAQYMRRYSRLIAAYMRREVHAGRHDEAVRYARLGMAFSRHLAEAPFLVNGLIGIAGARLIHADLLELVTQPGAPNLYWALASLPHPFINLRRGMETERGLLRYKIPELADLRRPRDAAEWQRLEGELRAWANQLDAAIKEMAIPAGEDQSATQPSNEAALQAAQQATSAPEFRVFLLRLGQFTEAEITAMSPFELMVRRNVAIFEAAYDEELKQVYARWTPPPGELPRESIPLAQSLVPAIGAAHRAEKLLERDLALLQTVEALRLHAAGHDRRLPQTLDELEPPAPDDPLTGRPFGFTRHEDGSVELASQGPRGVAEWSQHWRVRLRQSNN